MSYLSVDKLQDRGLYRIHSRNLVIGAWDGSEGFIGIRTKFGERFLFKELHWDVSQSFGTAKPIELIDIVPDDIEIIEGYSICNVCEESNPDFDKDRGETAKERWYHLSGRTDHDVVATRRMNHILFDWIDERLAKEK